MVLTDNILKIASVFKTDGTPADARPYGSGHINGTYLVTTDTGAKYTLQSINANVFKNPRQVMSNISLVLSHIRKNIEKAGGDTARECLTIVDTKGGENLYVSEMGYFRMYNFIEGNIYESVEKPDHFYRAAKAFGKFQNQLSDFPAEKLYETISKFHDTKWRFENLEKAIAGDTCGRLADVKDEVEFALKRRSEAGKIIDAIEKGEIPLRVTHNDTKFNNVLLDDEGNGFCVIDLDTVMPGSMLYDFGDSIRSGAHKASEDEKDLSRVNFDLVLFEAYTRGFLEALGDRITEKELSLMAFSAKLITLECGIRFLTDYLEGDTYFKIHYPEQNLDRTRTQFKLVSDMEKNMGEMEKIVRKYSK